MPWKTRSKRSLHIGPKVKLPSGHPLPESVEDMAVKIEDRSPDERGDVTKEKNLFQTSDLVASLPSVSGEVESRDFSFDRYISDLEVDQGSDDCHSLFDDSGTSTLGQSASSFMSWMDEAELEKSKEVQRLVDEIDDAIYEAAPFPVTDQKALEVLHQIKNSRLHLRVVGKHLENIPSSITALDEDLSAEQDVIEVLASHGVYVDYNKIISGNTAVLPKEDNADICKVNQDPDVECNIEDLALHHENEGFNSDRKFIVERTDADAVNRTIADNTNRFLEKVKSYVMDQLACYIFSEAVKPYEVMRHKNIPSLSEDDEVEDLVLSSPRPNTREDDDVEDKDLFQRPDCVQQLAIPLEESSIMSDKHAFTSFLHVSPMTIHPLPRKSVTRLRCSTSNYSFDVPFYLSQPSPIRSDVKGSKPNLFGPSQISVMSLSKPSNILPHCIEAEKGVKVRGYHSAAAVKKHGMLDRRFSITAGHERFLEPLVEKCSANKHRQQASVPSSPARWLRRHTLPPINSNGLVSLSKSPEAVCSNTSLLASKLLESSKNKVTLLPLKVPVLGSGLTRLELAKQLLEQSDHSVLWNTNGAFDTSDENIRELAKTNNGRKPRGGKRL